MTTRLIAGCSMLVVLAGCGLLALGCTRTDDSDNFDAGDIHAKVLNWIANPNDRIKFPKKDDSMRLNWEQGILIINQGKYRGAISMYPRTPKTDKLGFNYHAFYELNGKTFDLAFLVRFGPDNLARVWITGWPSTVNPSDLVPVAKYLH